MMGGRSAGKLRTARGSYGFYDPVGALELPETRHTATPYLLETSVQLRDIFTDLVNTDNWLI